MPMNGHKKSKYPLIIRLLDKLLEGEEEPQEEGIGEFVESPSFEDLIYTESQGEFMNLALTNIKRGMNLHLLFSGFAGTGKTYCMPKGTLVKTPNGLTPIEKANKVLSYNFKKKRVEIKNSIITNSGLKEVVKIHTSKGIIKCSPEHKWFVLRLGKREIVKTKDLRTSDHLISIQ